MKSIFYLLLFLSITSCTKHIKDWDDDPKSILIINTSPVTLSYQLNSISGTGGGTITQSGGSPILSRGLVWDINPNPTISSSSKTIDGSGTGSFTSQLNGLKSATKYYVRAYATNRSGTIYGNEINFTTDSINLKNGLLLYLPFTGNAADSSGNNNNGSVTGALLTTDRHNNPNSAYSFSTDGAGFGSIKDQIYVNYNPQFNVSTITVALWVNPTAYFWTGNPNDPGSILINRFEGGYSNPNSQAWGIRMDSTKLLAFLLQASSVNAQASSVVNTPSPISLNTWTHVAFTYDGSNLKLYLNGQLVGNTATTLPLNTNSTSGISIGQSRQANGNWNDFAGKLDEVMMWNRALTDKEIKVLADH